MAAAHDAVDRIEPDLRDFALGQGLNLVIECERVMGEEPEFADWAVGLAGDGSTVVSEMMGDLTAHGRKVFDSSWHSVAPLSVRRHDVLAHGVFVPPFAPNEDSDRPETRRAFQQCSRFTPLTLALGSPMRWASPVVASLLREDGGGVAETLAAVLDSRPELAQLAMTLDSPPKLALAMTYSTAADSNRTRSALNVSRAETHVSQRNGKHVVLTGVGVDPRAVFDLAEAGGIAGVFAGEFDLRSSDLEVTNVPLVAQARVEITDGILVGQATWSASEMPELDLPRPRKPAHASTTTELAPRGRACLRRLLGTVIPALVRMNDPW
ncbi:MAG: hypothetical protein K0V04_33905, partial [Deltaproteobacteria bacterium]|nr:hypothetical protein [Deltaproteobacteria bacterium]